MSKQLLFFSLEAFQLLPIKFLNAENNVPWDGSLFAFKFLIYEINDKQICKRIITHVSHHCVIEESASTPVAFSKVIGVSLVVVHSDEHLDFSVWDISFCLFSCCFFVISLPQFSCVALSWIEPPVFLPVLYFCLFILLFG